VEELGDGQDRQRKHDDPAQPVGRRGAVADSEDLVKNSGLPESALIEVGIDHRLADPEPLTAMLEACQKRRTDR
jgi:hypothetical protein